MGKVKVAFHKALFKKTSTGAIQQWEVIVTGTDITTVYGQVGGKLQKTTDPIKSGKNIGRENETAPEEQAVKEAKSLWLKKKKAGYVESLKDAESGKTDDIIEGGITPMLAKVYEEHFHKIKWSSGEVYVQPKLDGIRCIAIHEDGEVTLWTRTRKRITSCPHIEEGVAEFLFGRPGKTILDGELYSSKLSSDFEKIVSAVRKKKSSKEALQISYHVYDLVEDKPFADRISTLELWDSHMQVQGIEVVDTHPVSTPDTVKFMADQFIEFGYEGAMVRHSGRSYEYKRTDQLLKVKTFEDAEFKIVGIEEGGGKLSGHAGSFICVNSKGKKFGAKLVGSTARLKVIFENPDKYIGKMLTVKYQGMTNEGIPRFPVGLRIRDDLW